MWVFLFKTLTLRLTFSHNIPLLILQPFPLCFLWSLFYTTYPSSVYLFKTSMFTGYSILTGHKSSPAMLLKQSRSNNLSSFGAESIFVMRSMLNSAENTLKMHCKPIYQQNCMHCTVWSNIKATYGKLVTEKSHSAQSSSSFTQQRDCQCDSTTQPCFCSLCSMLNRSNQCVVEDSAFLKLTSQSCTNMSSSSMLFVCVNAIKQAIQKYIQ